MRWLEMNMKLNNDKITKTSAAEGIKDCDWLLVLQTVKI